MKEAFEDPDFLREFDRRVKKVVSSTPLDRENFSPGMVPQDAIYGSPVGIVIGATVEQNIPASTVVEKSFDSVLYQRGKISMANNVITLGEAGVYVITHNTLFFLAAVNSLVETAIELAAPGSPLAVFPRITQAQTNADNTLGSANASGAGIFPLAAGSQLRMFAYSTSTSTIYGNFQGLPLANISVFKIGTLGQRLFSDVGDAVND